MMFAADSLLHAIPPTQQTANHAGRERSRGGVLATSPYTRVLTRDDYAALDLDFLDAAACSELTNSFDALRNTLNAKNLNNDYWQGRLLFAHEVAAHSPIAGRIMKQFQLEATRCIGAFYRLTQPLYAYIKPKAGMLVAFTAGFHHEHAVLKVASGERLTMPAFYTFQRSKADFFIHRDPTR